MWVQVEAPARRSIARGVADGSEVPTTMQAYRHERHAGESAAALQHQGARATASEGVDTSSPTQPPRSAPTRSNAQTVRSHAGRDTEPVENHGSARPTAKPQPTAVEPGPVSLYRFRDANGELLYVGLTRSGQRRFRKHAEEKDWWPLVTRVDVEHFPTADEAVEAERAAIRAEHPRFNRQEWRIEIRPGEMSVDEAAEHMGISRKSVFLAIHNGSLAVRAEKRGRRIQYAVLVDQIESGQ